MSQRNIQLREFKKLYYIEKLCMREIAELKEISLNKVVYFVRKNKLKPRNFSEMNKIRFDKKPLSFKISSISTLKLNELKVAGAMLYWAEGYNSEKSKIVDFANSKPEMVLIFLSYLRNIYRIDEKRIKILLYCHANQNQSELIDFWSQATGVPTAQFSKPYVRKDNNSKNSRIMTYGLIHIRYSDKKLLAEIKNTITAYVNKHTAKRIAGIREAVKPSGL